MKNIELGEKLKNRFKELEALIADELGAEKMGALSNIIHFNDVDDITDIVDDDRFDYDYNYNYKAVSKDDFINACVIIFADDTSTRDEVIAEYVEKVNFDNIDEIKASLKYIYENEQYAVETLLMLMSAKYYKYFTLDFIKEFLGE